MKKIEAIIKPFKLDEVKEALHEVNVPDRHRGQGLRASKGAYGTARGICRGFPAQIEN